MSDLQKGSSLIAKLLAPSVLVISGKPNLVKMPIVFLLFPLLFYLWLIVQTGSLCPCWWCGGGSCHPYESHTEQLFHRGKVLEPLQNQFSIFLHLGLCVIITRLKQLSYLSLIFFYMHWITKPLFLLVNISVCTLPNISTYDKNQTAVCKYQYS